MMMRHVTTLLEGAVRCLRAVLAGRQVECFLGPRSRWIRGLRAENADAIGIEPVHTGVDSCGLRGLPAGRSARRTEFNPIARGQFYRSLDGGETWSELPQRLGEIRVLHLVGQRASLEDVLDPYQLA